MHQHKQEAATLEVELVGEEDVASEGELLGEEVAASEGELVGEVVDDGDANPGQGQRIDMNHGVRVPRFQRNGSVERPDSRLRKDGLLQVGPAAICM